jgi:hypothetical protein
MNKALAIVRAMPSCAHCGEKAVTQIPATPGQVCRAHAEEYWAGLLIYARDQRSQPGDDDETSCVCRVNNLASVKPRMIAADAAAPPAEVTERLSWRRAS